MTFFGLFFIDIIIVKIIKILFKNFKKSVKYSIYLMSITCNLKYKLLKKEKKITRVSGELKIAGNWKLRLQVESHD